MALGDPALAGPPVLELPIDCSLGQDCFIEDYVDADPTAGQHDYRCGLKSRDGHRGTDFVLDSFEKMEAGVAILAAASGVVEAIREGVPDQPLTAENKHQIKGRECGNAVRLNHGDGWHTLYCHMALGSVRVAVGDQVAAGDTLGQVGLSGQTNVPHVHFTVLRGGRVIDPFRPDDGQSCKEDAANGLWRNAPEYNASGLFTAGFSTAVPGFDDVRSGAARRVSGSAEDPIVLYGHAFFGQSGDRLTLNASGPDGEIFTKTIEITETKAELFHAFGRKSPPGGWPSGNYRGYVTLKRDGRLLAVRHADFTINR